MNKIRQYFSTFDIIRGFLIAFLGSAFIYLNYWGHSHPFITTIFGVTSLHLLLQEKERTWFIYGFFTGLFWFWWIGLSFEHYKMIWAILPVIFFIAFAYGFIFWFIAFLAEKSESKYSTPFPTALVIKALAILLLSYLHPFGFDWLKLELMFVESYLGIEKWQFSIILFASVLAHWKKELLWLFLVLFAYQPANTNVSNIPYNVQIITTHTSVKDKWNTSLHSAQFDALFKTIDQAIEQNKTLIILPESVFPLFLNHSQPLIDKLQEKAQKIAIVTGGLYWDGKVPHNSTYIFNKNKISVAHKVILVPFGERNPLPNFLSDWVNQVFYDGAIDYQASSKITDYIIDRKTYRNAICFEATSEKLYEKDKHGNYPKNMIVLSNNGWFTPSTEPTLQKLLLQYYSKKYGTTIYHAVNMSESYVIKSEAY
ncbi:MAG: apolipoprotein N-acyltransferase [Campylobacterota bacterium]|nr:apolipoprotein N-acyltransferase [Campylobacterota bacterium]